MKEDDQRLVYSAVADLQRNGGGAEKNSKSANS